MTDAEYSDLWIICRQFSRMVGNAAEWECIKYCLDSLTIHVNANTVADMKDRQFFLLNVQGFLEVDSDLATLKLESTLYMTATHLSNGPTMTSTLNAVGGLHCAALHWAWTRGTIQQVVDVSLSSSVSTEFSTLKINDPSVDSGKLLET